MESSTLSGRSILIAEDEPLIALDIAEAFKDAGATTIVTSTIHYALVLVEHDGLSAAVPRRPLISAYRVGVCVGG
jgi:CheY-like chemotaxis protein